MTESNTQGTGENDSTVPAGLRDKAKDVLARGAGDAAQAPAAQSKDAARGVSAQAEQAHAAEKESRGVDATEAIPPVIVGSEGAPKAPTASGTGSAQAHPGQAAPSKAGASKAAPAAASKADPKTDPKAGAAKAAAAQRPSAVPPAQGAPASNDTTQASVRPRTASTDQPTQAMSAVGTPSGKRPPAPAAPPVPERPLFADGPRTAPTASVPAATDTAVVPAVADAPAATGAQARKPKAATQQKSARKPAARKARLRLVKVDPWSVMKTSFLLSLAFGVVLFVAVTMIWLVLGAAGVWDSVNEAVAEFDGNSSTFDITTYLSTSRVLGLTALVAVVDVVLMTALATLTAFLYNMSASLLGGVELTFAEERN